MGDALKVQVRSLNRIPLATEAEARGNKEYEVWFEDVPEAIRRRVEDRVGHYLLNATEDGAHVIAAEVRGGVDNFRLAVRPAWMEPGSQRLMFRWTGGHGGRTDWSGPLTVVVVLAYSRALAPLVDVFEVEGEPNEQE